MTRRARLIRAKRSCAVERLLSLLLCMVFAACTDASNEVADRLGDEYFWRKKIQSPLSELSVYAKKMALKRGQLKLAKHDPKTQKQYQLIAEYRENKDHDKVVELLSLLAEQGYADAQRDLARIHCREASSGVEKFWDAEKSLYWIKKAVDAGYSHAQFTYSLYFYDGECGIQQDWGKYAEWLFISAEQGAPLSQSVLSSAYVSGKGVEKDLIESYKWSLLALRRYGHPDNVPAYHSGKVASTLILQDRLTQDEGVTKEQVQEAQRRAKEWEKTHPYAYQHYSEMEPLGTPAI
jgi:TPR repeat protein